MDKKIKKILLKKIEIPDICDKIINIKNKEILKEHIKYRKLGPEIYYKAIKNPYKIISYVIEDKEYIVNTDKYIEYYLYTKYSFQSWDLLMDLIKIKNKEIREEDDKIYSKLSNKIKNNLEEISIKYINNMDID